MGGQQASTPSKRSSIVAALAAVALCFTALFGAIPPAGAGDALCQNISPQGEIAIANNNLEERDITDMSNTKDMQIFVDRLMNGAGTAAGHQIPVIPDVVLLQEVRDKSANVVAALLEAETGCAFSVAVSPGDQYAQQFDGYALFKETAILLNDNTMTSLDKGGFVVTKYSRRQASPEKRAFKSNAYGYAKDIDSGLTISLASVHLAKDSSLKTMEIARKKKNAWARQIAANLRNKYPNADMSAIAGDFNAHRCNGGDQNCPGAPFWRTLRYDFNYLDSYFAMHDFGRYIDYIWGKTFVVDADEDTLYDHSGADHDPIYSDHQFRWAILANSDVLPPKPFKIFKAEGWGGTNPRIQMSWTESFDGGGLVGYRIMQATPIAAPAGSDTCPAAQDFVLAARVATDVLPMYEDKATFTKGERRCFQVIAIDKAGNQTAAKIKDPLDAKTAGVRPVGDDMVIIQAGG